MSGGVGGGAGGSGSRVLIPGSVRRTIQNIKEIAGNHSDDEVYAMLKECAMDPNETAQRLLHQDTFHEVKRKRDKRKEGNREPVDSRWNAGVQGRGSRVSKVGLSHRYVTKDAGGRNLITGKENGVGQGIEKGKLSTSTIVQDVEIKPTLPLERSVAALANGPSTVATGSVVGNAISVEEVSSITTEKIVVNSGPTGSMSHSKPGKSNLNLDHICSSVQSASSTGVYALGSDPILVPDLDTHASGSRDLINHEVVNQITERTISKAASSDIARSEISSVNTKGSSEMRYSSKQGKFQGKSHGSDSNRHIDTSQDYHHSRASSWGSRPPSNYSSRSQQLSGSVKVGLTKEWKPKPTHTNAPPASETTSTSVIIPVLEDPKDQPLLPTNSAQSEDVALKLKKKVEELQFSDAKHVIIPNHLQVPESERSGLSFGSFDSSFGLDRFINSRSSEKGSSSKSESSHELEDNMDESSSSICMVHPAEPEVPNLGHPQLPSRTPGGDTSSEVSQVQECDQTKVEAALTSEGPQHTVVQTTPYSAVGVVPQMLTGQFASFEGTDNHNRDASLRNSFLVPQHFDPSSYGTQLYRPAEGGRFSPFLSPGATVKYNGNIPILPSQTGQTPHEGGNALILPSGPTIATQAAGVVQSSIPAAQQQVPLFRQPTGVHLQHFPPNYHLPYSQYITPYVVPTLHPLLGNMPFPQQPPGGIFPPPVATASVGPKFGVSQYKPVANSGNSTHIGVPTGYTTYSANSAAYGPSPAVMNTISTNEDLTATQFKENNVYMTAQQTEGSAVWIPAPSGRDLPAMQASFYNLPHQGQHMPLAHSQGGHGAFAGIYHPTQAVAAAALPLLQPSQAMAGAVEMVGPPTAIYQQPQRAQINWASTF